MRFENMMEPELHILAIWRIGSLELSLCKTPFAQGPSASVYEGTKTICFVATSHKFSPIAVRYSTKGETTVPPPSPGSRRGRGEWRCSLRNYCRHESDFYIRQPPSRHEKNWHERAIARARCHARPPAPARPTVADAFELFCTPLSLSLMECLDVGADV